MMPINKNVFCRLIFFHINKTVINSVALIKTTKVILPVPGIDQTKEASL
jgi:hypothetical protein